MWHAQCKAAKEVFQQLFDTELSGSISLSKFHHTLSDFGHSEREIEMLCHSLDTNADGVLTLNEFVHGYPRYHSLVD